MTKKQAMSRWHCIRKFIETMGGEAELDVISAHQINVIVQSRQNLTGLLEWAYLEWDDVKTVGQMATDGQKAFFVVFGSTKAEDLAVEEE